MFVFTHFETDYNIWSLLVMNFTTWNDFTKTYKEDNGTLDKNGKFHTKLFFRLYFLWLWIEKYEFSFSSLSFLSFMLQLLNLSWYRLVSRSESVHWRWRRLFNGYTKVLCHRENFATRIHFDGEGRWILQFK